jgi:hypothetical protein
VADMVLVPFGVPGILERSFIYMAVEKAARWRPGTVGLSSGR